MARIALVALIALATLVAGCGRGDASGADGRDRLTSEEFVEIVAALREAERAVVDQDSASARFAERKAAILAEHETTESELLDFVAREGDDVARLQAVWDTISQRLKHATEEAGTTQPRDPTQHSDTTPDPPVPPDVADPRPPPGAVKYPGGIRTDSLRDGPAPAVEDSQRPEARPVPGERRLH